MFIFHILSFILIIIFIIYIILTIVFNYLYPYPDNINECEDVYLITKERTKEDIDFFHKVNKNVLPAFSNILSEKEIQYMKYKLFFENIIIILCKCFFLRPRPYMYHSKIDDIVLSKDTSYDLFSYPSGHSYHAYYIAKYYSRIYPDLKDKLYDIAERCSFSRVKGGVHYPSDIEFGKYIVEHFR